MSTSHLMETYARLPITFTRGEGIWLWSREGKRYLDAVAGVAVNAIGHCHPKLVAALREQVGTLIHTSNLYQIEAQEKLADKICELSGMDKVFFCNSGAEANECAIKLARYYGHKKNIDNPAVVVLEKSFHGRTLATLSATGSRKVQAGFEPLVSGFVRVPFDDLEAVRKVAASNKNVVAILAELVQGEGGVGVCSPGYLKGLREICDANGWLLMLDEVQTGIGRTGTMFGFQHYGVMPDVMALAKGLGGGVPIGACVAKGEAAKLFTPGTHGSTFGGTPLACTAALATLDVMVNEKVCENATEIGEHIRASLKRQLAETPGVKEIRGQGMLNGIELDRPCGDLVKIAMDKGFLINVTADTVVRFAPPLVMNKAEADQLVNGVVPLIREFLMKPAPEAAAKTA
ncbi:MAG: aspartate aminotransferase family protein [Betaproteobacteria bacterium]|nr:aspartate aminotransferase family protein [Betaproteobacteria bacterium]